MCISFQPTTNEVWTKKNFGLTLPATPHQEVYPGYQAPIVIKSHQSQRVAIGLAEFGLIPPWAKEKKIQKHTYNARSETVTIKPSYRQAWSRRHFGIVLVDHFFEPSYQSGKAQKWRIGLANQEPMGIAVLWEKWLNPEDQQTVVSFTMLTVNADHHPVMSQFHKPAEEKRSPLILPPSQFAGWLDGDLAKIPTELNTSSFPPLCSQVERVAFATHKTVN